MILSERKVNINVIPNQETLMKIYCDDAIRLLNNKFCGLSSSSGYASLLFDQEVPSIRLCLAFLFIISMSSDQQPISQYFFA